VSGQKTRRERSVSNPAVDRIAQRVKTWLQDFF
jgi:hypothetical protein